MAITSFTSSINPDEMGEVGPIRVNEIILGQRVAQDGCVQQYDVVGDVPWIGNHVEPEKNVPSKNFLHSGHLFDVTAPLLGKRRRNRWQIELVQ